GSRRELRIDAAELSALDSAADQFRQLFQARPDDLREIEHRQFWEAAGFADDQLWDGGAPRVARHRDYLLQENVERGEGAAAGPRAVADIADGGDQGLPDHFLEQLRLVVEVAVEQALGDAGGHRHVVQLGGGEALPDKHGQCGVQNLFRPVGRAPAPAWRGCGFLRTGDSFFMRSSHPGTFPWLSASVNN